MWIFLESEEGALTTIPPLAEAAAAAAPAAGFGVPRDAGARERCQVYVVGKDVSSWKLTNSCWEQRPGCEMGV